MDGWSELQEPCLKVEIKLHFRLSIAHEVTHIRAELRKLLASRVSQLRMQQPSIASRDANGWGSGLRG
jgi:hypothetical protein